MIIKPLEENNKKKVVILKLFFILFLFFSGFFTRGYLFNNEKQNKDKPQVLGEQDKNLAENNSVKDKKSLNLDFLFEKINETEKLLSNIGNSTAKEVNFFIENTQDKIASSISEIIYQTSIEPIVSQIKKLPTDQQEKIKKDICQQ